VRFYATGLTLKPEDYIVCGKTACCARCDFKCVHSRTMENHVNREHKKNTAVPYECSCGKSFWARDALSQHKRRALVHKNGDVLAQQQAKE
jgi:hypothetical protein